MPNSSLQKSRSDTIQPIIFASWDKGVHTITMGINLKGNVIVW